MTVGYGNFGFRQWCKIYLRLVLKPSTRLKGILSTIEVSRENYIMYHSSEFHRVLGYD